jgi:hypothetical protein
VEVVVMAEADPRADIGPKNRLNALVIDEVAHLVYGPTPTDDEYNAVAADMCESEIHGDIAKLAEDIRGEAERIAARRGF